MKYYFTTSERMLANLNEKKGITRDYIILYNWLMAPINEKIDYVLGEENKTLRNEFNFFMLESCRFFMDKEDFDRAELASYYELVMGAYNNLLIDRKKVEEYFKGYVNDLFVKKAGATPITPPKNLSEVVIKLMVDQLDISSVMNYVNLSNQEIDIQSIGNTVQLEKINFVKGSIHDKVLFFIEYYNSWISTVVNKR